MTDFENYSPASWRTGVFIARATKVLKKCSVSARNKTVSSLGVIATLATMSVANAAAIPHVDAVINGASKLHVTTAQEALLLEQIAKARKRIVELGVELAAAELPTATPARMERLQAALRARDEVKQSSEDFAKVLLASMEK